MARACRIFDILPNSNDRKFQSPHCNIMEKTRQNTQEATFFSFLTPSIMFAVLGMVLWKKNYSFFIFLFIIYDNIWIQIFKSKEFSKIGTILNFWYYIFGQFARGHGLLQFVCIKCCSSNSTKNNVG